MNIPRLPTVVIENVSPVVDGGRLPLKRVVGEGLVVEADVFKDGHDITVAVLKWRPVGAKNPWRETPMQFIVNDRWRAECRFTEVGPHEFTVEAWQDTFASWQHEFDKKYQAGITELATEIEEGARLFERAATLTKKAQVDASRLRELAIAVRVGTPADVDRLAHDPEVIVLLETYGDRAAATELRPAVPVYVDRERARFAAWYEFFPRCAEGKPDSTSTFRDCLGRVDDAAAMGFDVIYFPPIHPIGFTKRKGRNNSTTSEPGEPGSPYAIGGPAGGHKQVEPTLGTLKDFDWLVKKIQAKGMEVALDFAINCSPDHPYVKDHPDWFFQRPDGTIKYAENPPKRYEDIYPLNFHCDDWKNLWQEMASIILFWCARKGCASSAWTIPHTKPVAFWGWMIEQVRAAVPRRHLPLRGLHQTQDDEGSGEGRFHPELQLFHLAQHQGGTHRVLHRTHPDGDEGLLPCQPFPEHAGHPPVLPPARRTPRLHDPRRPLGHALHRLRHLQRFRTL